MQEDPRNKELIVGVFPVIHAEEISMNYDIKQHIFYSFLVSLYGKIM